MKRIVPIFLFALLTIRPAPAQTLTGSLSNFDVFNDTGQQSHGFEIELDGLTSNDISSTFGGPGYIRYDVPKLVDVPGVSVIVRYASPYAGGVFTVGTPVPQAFTPTAGHSCWTGGSLGAAAYLASGCEHFGVGMFKTPTAVVYRWLIEDPNAPGSLIPASSNVNIAAPLWTVTLPAVAGGAAVVNAAIVPPKPEKQQLNGDAVWVKVYETESPDLAKLENLLTDDPSVPSDLGPAEVEWELSQTNAKPGNGALQHGKPLGKGNQSVTRRFEFYKYTGAYDNEHEALCGSQSASGKGGGCGALQPADVAQFVGDYIGAQMAAAQLGPLGAPPVAPKVAIAGVSDNASGQAGIASGSWISIYGSALSATTRSWQKADFQGSNLPVALDGVSVTINGKAAAVWFISPGQLNVQAPADNAAGPVQVQVTNASGSATGTATLQPYAPGFFTFQGKYAAAVHVDGAYVAPIGFFGGAVASRPAQPGETLLVFGSGFGPTAPAVPVGQVFSGAAALADLSQLHVRIGGVPVTVQFAGIVAAGEYQFNLVVPALPGGDQLLTADIGGVATQPGLSIPIGN
jgi:uncharacterized protein (TIGR03437 family)